MALILPYPNLDFVPLDVLTAEEMNEIVANYTFIANQFPPSVPYVTVEQSTTITVSNTTDEAKMSATIPEDGVYFCVANALYESNTSQIHDTWLYLMKNGAGFGKGMSLHGNQQGAVTGIMSLSVSAVGSFSAGDTISLGSSVSGAQTLLKNRILTAIRIA